jgi:HEAT repeat protein
VQAAALSHPDIAMRRFCLFLLDHYASDASSETFRCALRDPVASIRESALHGLACERCRFEDICVTDVVSDLIEILASDPNPDVRYKAVAALARFAGRDSRVGESVARAVHDDPDSAIRQVAQAVAAGGQIHVRRQKVLRAVRQAKRFSFQSPVTG